MPQCYRVASRFRPALNRFKQQLGPISNQKALRNKVLTLHHSLVPLLEEVDHEDGDKSRNPPPGTRGQFLIFKEINDVGNEGLKSTPKSPSGRKRAAEVSVATVGGDARFFLLCVLAILAVLVILFFVFFQCFCPDAKLHVAFQCNKPEEIIV